MDIALIEFFAATAIANVALVLGSYTEVHVDLPHVEESGYYGTWPRSGGILEKWHERLAIVSKGAGGYLAKKPRDGISASAWVRRAL